MSEPTFIVDKNHPKSTVKIPGSSTELDIPFYIQWIPGYVAAVITSDKSKFYNGPRTINSVLAFRHFDEDGKNIKEVV